MDIELKQAQAKYEREQKQRADLARQRMERERKAKDEARARQAAMEEAQRIRRLEEAAAAETARLQREQDIMAGGGVEFNRVFFGALSSSGTGDKITMPPSAIAELSDQSALEKGPMLFEISLASSTELSGPSPSSSSTPQRHPGESEAGGKDGLKENGRRESGRTHGGVMEFTAEEGWVGLPPHVWENLGLGSLADGGSTHGTEAVRVRVRYVRLGRCTYTKLQPLGLDFADVPNHKAVLETALRGHATLTEGDILRLTHGGHAYALRVLELKPEPQVTIIDADVETDVVPPEASDVAASGGARTRVPLTLGKPESSSVEQGQYRYFQFNVDEALARSVATGDVELVVSLDVVVGEQSKGGGGGGGDADLYVGAHPLLYPTQHQHGWSNHDAGSKVVAISGSMESEGGSSGGGQLAVHAGGYSIGVYGYQGRTEFSISVASWPRRGEGAAAAQAGKRIGAGSGAAEEGAAGFGQCSNCQQRVPEASLMLHEAYCRRHNIACDHPGCGAVLRRQERDEHVHCSACGQGMRSSELEKHRRVNHEALTCECGAVLPMAEMVKHRAESCRLRSITCRFCGDIVQAGGDATSARDRLAGLTGHEAECGSRTAPCDICGRAIMLKDADVHLAAVHAASTAHVPMPQPSTSSPLGTPTSNRAQTQEAMQSQPSATAPLACPVCSLEFAGGNRERDLDRHLDEHFNQAPSPPPVDDRMDVDSDNQGTAATDRQQLQSTARFLDSGRVEETVGNRHPSADSSGYRRTAAVECPICGTSVHSERDLSAHFDLVH